jgi:glycosyltransferase involved in cell wall biosynthesis
MKIGVMLRTIDEKQGIGIYTLNLMDHLLQLDKKNDYVLFFRNPQFIGRYAQYAHVKEKLIPGSNKAFWDQVKIPIEASRENVDIVFHTKFTVPFFTRRKTVMVLHGSEWLFAPKWFKMFDRIYINLLMPRYCKKASAIIANSDVTKKDFISILGVPEEKIKLIYHGLDPKFKHIDDHDFLGRVQEKYSLPERFILYVGRIHPGKNFGNLIKAFFKIHNELPHKVLVVGHPRWGYHHEYSIVKELGLDEKFIFPGWVPQEELVAFYNLADLFIFPSFYEGFGIPLLEAMACGCPAVVSNTGNLPYLARGAALLVDPYKPDEIAGAIHKILTEDGLRKELIEKGLHRAQAFSWEKCAKETLALFESLNHLRS